jgi:hypothetical protein
VTAWCIGNEIAIRFLQPPFPEIVELVGLALPDKGNREPAAALPAAAAGAGCRSCVMRFHTNIRLDRNRRKDNGSPERFRILTTTGEADV